MNNYKRIFFVFAAFILGCFLAVNTVKAAVVGMPTIVEVASGCSCTTSAKPLVTGLTQKGTEVLIYLDGKFLSLATVNSKGTATDNFYYRFTSLSAGEHKITIIARDKTSLVLSAPTKEYCLSSGYKAEKQIVSKPVFILAAPTILEPNEKTATANVKPLIKGVTKSGTIVHIYIDGVYNGKTKKLEDKSGAVGFIYRPFLNLSRSQHTIKAISEGPDGKKSKATYMTFGIEKPMPAPTLVKPKNQTVYTPSNFLLTGLAKNDSVIKVYLDYKMVRTFKVKNSPSGTAHFYYLPTGPLTRGAHMVYATAIDARGKESSWSEVRYFRVYEPEISAGASETTTAAKPSDEASKNDVVEEKAVEENKGVTQEATTSGAVAGGEKITNGEGNVLGEGTSQVENTNKKIPTNLIIFIVFLIGVIIWIIWVNRELIRERRLERKDESAQNKKDNTLI